MILTVPFLQSESSLSDELELISQTIAELSSQGEHSASVSAAQLLLSVCFSGR